MSAQTETARAEFDVAMADAQNLVDIHRDLNLSRGRRFREMTINQNLADAPPPPRTQIGHQKNFLSVAREIWIIAPFIWETPFI